jgi:cyclopropane fatty-acyl-phospholipid synthase-like methyltransferase
MSTTTMNFYNSAADEYVADKNTPNPRLFAFLKRCKAAGKILELGTGGGVDAAAILESGFDLDATDGSSELAAIASQRLGQPVRTMLFNQLDAVEFYDGVYACAALTHAPRADLRNVIERIHRALCDNGVVWASFKVGTNEGTDALGRYYNFLPQDELTAIWRETVPWRVMETESWLGGGYDRTPTQWAAITAIK